MTILQVYEKYKHLDQLLSDTRWVEDNLKGRITYELWQAIKVHAQRKAAKVPCPDKLESLENIEVIPESMDGTLIS